MPKKVSQKKLRSTPLQTLIIVLLVLIALGVNLFGSFKTNTEVPPEPTEDGVVLDEFEQEER